MSDNSKTNSNATFRENLKAYYDKLMKEAEEENRKRTDELQKELLTEDPLNINYARWETETAFKRDLKEVSFEECTVEKSGVPLLCSDGVAYVDTSDSHSLIIGSSGSKKTRLFILPSILCLAKAGESMVITDPKAELYERTSGYLKKKNYKVFCINFRDDSVNNAWNPLDTPLKFFKQGKFDLSVGLLNDFASITIPIKSRYTDPFWEDSARTAFMGLLLILFMLAEDEGEVNIRSLLRLRATLYNNKSKGDNCLSKITKLAGLDSLLSTYLSVLTIAPEKTFASIIATLDTYLMKFVIRPSLTDMMCHNDIRFGDVGREKTAIFLVMPDEKETYHGLISIFVQQCYEYLIFEAQKCSNKTLPVRVNFLLDEFSSLPRIKEFPSMISAARSRNIRFNIVIQSEKQLKGKYDEDADTIKGNCNNWIYLYSREYPTLCEISNLCGTQKSGKPLITTSRLQRLDKDKGEVLVMHGRKYPFISFLKDINEYDQERLEKPYHESHNFNETIKIFDYISYMHTMDEKYVCNRLRKNDSTASTKILEYTSKICVNDLFGNFVEETDVIRIASLKWYKRNIDSFRGKSIELPKDVFCEIIETPNNTLYTREPLSVKALPEIVSMVQANTAIIGTDFNLLDNVAKAVCTYFLNSKKSIPLYFDCRHFEVPFNLRNEEIEKPCLLPLLLTKQFFDLPVKIINNQLESNLQKAYKTVLNAFDRDTGKSPEYVVILNAFENTPCLVDAIYQGWHLGARKNVRIIVLCTNEKGVLDKNCMRFYSNDETNKGFFSKGTLYYDDDRNEVNMKQERSPEFRIRLIEKK